MRRAAIRLMIAVLFAGCATYTTTIAVRDPGPRQGKVEVGVPLSGLSEAELALFTAGTASFVERSTVPRGLGPRFNLDSCAGCHAHPAVGGSSPALNPQVALATEAGATNVIPSFITAQGPVREVRFKRKPDKTPDGGVHNVFTIAGRSDAPGCRLAQPDFAGEGARDNVVLRIPTPLFGAGLMEAIPDHAILAQWTATAAARKALGIGGRPNRGGPGSISNDGSIGRFGWKAQNTSLLFFAGEAYGIEQGVTNELFPTERDETPGCRFNAAPEDHVNPAAATVAAGISDIQRFAAFVRFLGPPRPAVNSPSAVRGLAVFQAIGCALCHTPALPTERAAVAALSGQTVVLYSDLLLHHMGPGLADDIAQGGAGPDEFRSAPLWGLGQRLFFLHDGRTRDLLEAITAHASEKDKRCPASEANAVVERFRTLAPEQQQDLLSFLRSL
jgi:CxxC motif-containing protein (DUF1111 family)